MQSLTQFLSTLLVLVGSLFCLIGALGIMKMPSFITRVHAASLIDSFGAILIISGLILYAGLTLTAIKLILILLFLLITGPTAIHALVNTALHEDRHFITDTDEDSSSNT
ncbi:MAG: monovalent cation/H(+) antiporter subunit G [Gammaproteobacteria bacterium]|nr:monovalent cation/H(+) antiporter subunit G [Gammaproteobacteria bacterium]